MLAARVAVAYSGGRDSTALLHVAVRSAAALGVEVVALHVHHGLSLHADAWLRHCRETCRRWAARGAPLRFDAARLTTSPASGESVEAWARRERYAALAGLARSHGAGLVMLAHHRRDQAETVLLQGLRGAGAAGLAAMPREACRGGLRWVRPWLERSPDAIAAYVARHRLRWVEDDSNADPRFARNRLRLMVWPALVEAFPEAEASLAASARWAQAALDLQQDVGLADLASVVSTPSDGQEEALPTMALARWRDLSEVRRGNALRAWLTQCAGRPPPTSLVVRLMRQADGPGDASWPAGDGEIRRHRGVLSYVRASRPRPRPTSAGVPEGRLSVRGEGRIELAAWGGSLEVRRVEACGAALPMLENLRVAPRAGGESFQLAPNRPARSLKKQYQGQGVDRWRREGPLLYHGDQLVFAPGLGVDARAWARPGEPQFALRWLPAPEPRDSLRR